jgi:hypothetical protein
VTNSLLPQLFFSDRAKSVLRGVLFVYVGLVFRPIQYLAITERTSDDTWLFALSYAAAHHLAWGRDIIWTSGPLGYLAAPMDIGNCLALGLAFQAALWILLLAILWDLFSAAASLFKTLPSSRFALDSRALCTTNSSTR